MKSAKNRHFSVKRFQSPDLFFSCGDQSRTLESKTCIACKNNLIFGERALF